MDYTDFRRMLGERIRFIRKEKDITQEQVAELVNKTPEHISYIERGERSPSFELLIEFAHALDVPLPYLLDIMPSERKVESPIPAPIPSSPFPNTIIKDPIKSKELRKTDLERLHITFDKIKELQELADEYGINDIFQDNGGKVLQVLIILGLKVLPGREGNDAKDDDGNEYELKTLNYTLTHQFSTHHHMNSKIIKKYREVKAWYFAIYKGIELVEIWKVYPSKLEELFQRWETQFNRTSKELNNPKISLWFIQTGGECVYRNPVEPAIPLEREPRWHVSEKKRANQPMLLDLE